jgi:hypothetical protein
VLGHHRPRHALHVGEQDAALAQRGDRHAALDARGEALHPPDTGSRLEHVGRAEPEDRVRVLRERDGFLRILRKQQLHARRGGLQ